MQIERLQADTIRACLKTGCDYLELNREILDNLNVYPVPDGDTGVNMVATLKPAVEELQKRECASLAEISEVMRPALTGNSRGNSGFILAQFFSGFWSSVEGADRGYIDSSALGEGFYVGHFNAVTSLLSPVDGTMITVIAAMAETLKRYGGNDIVSTLQAALETGIDALFKTPAQLPLLAKAGVVDSGALGFIFIIKGMLYGIQNRNAQAEREDEYRVEPKNIADLPGAESGEQNEFRYCVELDIDAQSNALTGDFKSYLQQNGGSIAVIPADDRIRLHIHTNTPEGIIDRAASIGKILRRKIDDMDEQVAATGGKTASGTQETVSIVSIVPGRGFSTIFEELGASGCFVYSPRLPSVDDLVTFFNGVQSDSLIVLPNNPNIIPTVRLAAELTASKVHTLLTKSVVDGITAMYGYFESGSVNENIDSMSDCIGLAESVEVFRSTRDAVIGEIDIGNGDYFAVKDNKVLSTSPFLDEAVGEALKKIDLSDRSNLSLYHGDDFDTATLAEVENKISEMGLHLEIERLFGGQGNGLIIALE